MLATAAMSSQIYQVIGGSNLDIGKIKLPDSFDVSICRNGILGFGQGCRWTENHWDLPAMQSG